MELVKERASKNPRSFALTVAAVLLFFGGVFKYAYETSLEVTKQKTELEVKEAKSRQRDIELEKKEQQLDQRVNQLNEMLQKIEEVSKKKEQTLDGKLSILKGTERSASVEKQINDLINQYISDFSGLSKIQCGDDAAHNAKLRQAKAILGRLETLGELHQNVEATQFVKQQYNQSSISGWQARCK